MMWSVTIVTIGTISIIIDSFNSRFTSMDHGRTQRRESAFHAGGDGPKMGAGDNQPATAIGRLLCWKKHRVPLDK